MSFLSIAQVFDSRKHMVSKSFRYLLRVSEQSPLVGLSIYNTCSEHNLTYIPSVRATNLPQPGTLLYLGLCYYAQGRRVGAKSGGADSLLRLRLRSLILKILKTPAKSGGASAPSSHYYATPLLCNLSLLCTIFLPPTIVTTHYYKSSLYGGLMTLFDRPSCTSPAVPVG